MMLALTASITLLSGHLARIALRHPKKIFGCLIWDFELIVRWLLLIIVSSAKISYLLTFHIRYLHFHLVNWDATHTVVIHNLTKQELFVCFGSKESILWLTPTLYFDSDVSTKSFQELCGTFRLRRFENFNKTIWLACSSDDRQKYVYDVSRPSG